ncbi:RTA1 like protein-domain-containing protein [Diaporthe sp. PMI_573]|nr:RTA1 like protein-domain-containing protein [Diaporthaceae sp. PMI_573]
MAKSAYYNYEPSTTAAVIFIVLFAMTTIIHLWQMVRTKTLFLIPFLIGGFFELVGYIARMMSAKESPNFERGPFIIQSLLLLLGPALFAASIYMILGRIILVTCGEAHSPIRRRWLTKIFVTGDVVSFLAQAAGAVILASASSSNNSSSANLGQKIIIAGLFVQVFFFGVFIFTSVLFHSRIDKVPTNISSRSDMNWRRHMWALYAANVLIMLRSIFRVVEYIQGKGGFLQSKELFLYIFDAALMVAVMGIMNMVHPSEINAWLKAGRAIDAVSESEMPTLTTRESPAHKVR